MYLLDTDACIGLLNGTAPQLAQFLSQQSPRDIKLCAVVKAELYYGARHSRRVDEKLKLLDRFFESVSSVSFDDACAARYGAIRADLAHAGTPIGPNDLLVAAIARAHDLTLVTRNTREFRRVVGLRVTDWQAD